MRTGGDITIPEFSALIRKANYSVIFLLSICRSFDIYFRSRNGIVRLPAVNEYHLRINIQVCGWRGGGGGACARVCG